MPRETRRIPVALAVILGFVAFRQWIQHQRYLALHRERLAAIEKGIEPPPYPEEPPKEQLGALLFERRRRQWPAGAVLLLSGLIWLAIGFGGMIAGYVVLADPAMRALLEAPPPTAYLVGLVPTFVGIAHLVVWGYSRKGENQR